MIYQENHRVLCVVAMWTNLTFCFSITDAQLRNFQWIGPVGHDKSGDWLEPSNWRPNLEFNNTPNSFSESATIELSGVDPYEIRINGEITVGSITLDSPDAMLFGPGRNSLLHLQNELLLRQGSVRDLEFSVDGTFVQIWDTMRGDGVSVVAQGTGNELDLRGDVNSLPDISATLTADFGTATMMLASAGGGMTWPTNGQLVVDARNGSFAQLAMRSSQTSPLINRGLISTRSLDRLGGIGILEFALQNQSAGRFEVDVPTTLGTSSQTNSHVNYGTIDLTETLTIVAPVNVMDAEAPFTNAVSGLIGGTGTIVTPNIPLTNFGRIEPGVEVQGDLVNGSTAAWTFNVGGRSGFDQMVVDGDLALAGSYELIFADSFIPQRGDRFDSFSATGTISGQFDRIRLPSLGSSLAVELAILPNRVTALVKEPEIAVLESRATTALFSNVFGVAPQTDWRVQLQNVAGVPQQISVAENSTVHSMIVSGDLQSGATMALSIEDGATLSLTDALTVESGGLVTIVSSTVSNNLSLQATEATITKGTFVGAGNIEANLVNEGIVQIESSDLAPATLSVDGDYVQSSDGVLQIDLFETGHDQLMITGDLDLAGEVVLHPMGFDPEPGTSFTIADVGGVSSVVDEQLMCAFVTTTTRCMLDVDPTTGTVAAVSTFSADFNLDGHVDRQDFNDWLVNLGGSGPVGDADMDGDVDGDDLLVWQRQVGMSIPMPMESAVPEPIGNVLVVIAALMLLIRRR